MRYIDGRNADWTWLISAFVEDLGRLNGVLRRLRQWPNVTCASDTVGNSGGYLIDLHVLGADVGEVHAVKVARIYFKFLPPNGVLAPNHVAAVKPPYALILVELIPALLLQASSDVALIEQVLRTAFLSTRLWSLTNIPHVWQSNPNYPELFQPRRAEYFEKSKPP